MCIRDSIKGSQKRNRQPFVNYMRARYRAFGLRDRWDLIGERQFEAVLSVEDLRYITLLDAVSYTHLDVYRDSACAVSCRSAPLKRRSRQS